MGFPSPAKDYSEERISLDKEIIKHPNSTFFMHMEGDSMMEAHIPPGSLLVIDRSLKPRSSNIVVAIVNGEYIVRRLKKDAFKGWLIAENKKIKDLLIDPEQQVEIWGVVIAWVIDGKTVSNVRTN